MKKIILLLVCLTPYFFYAADKVKYDGPLIRSPKPYSPKSTDATDKGHGQSCYLPLHHACNAHDPRLTQLLIGAGADPFAQSKNELLPIEVIFSPLYAAKKQYKDGKKTFFIMLAAMHAQCENRYTLNNAKLIHTVEEAYSNLYELKKAFHPELQHITEQQLDAFKQTAITSINNPTALDDTIKH
ncbi:MAG: ankyrin repeat domain-containing protein [Candidatus Babeliales bacterium]